VDCDEIVGREKIRSEIKNMDLTKTTILELKEMMKHNKLSNQNHFTLIRAISFINAFRVKIDLEPMED
jgi:hypothetical protein